MPELTPDPVFDRLAGFTPASALDPAEVLFRAGRASARTPRGWKLAVVGLVGLNLATVGWVVVTRRPELPAAPTVAPEPPPPAAPSPVEPGSVGYYLGAADPDDRHRPEPAVDRLPDDADPLTLRAARRARFD